jgi:hypothetical protein
MALTCAAPICVWRGSTAPILSGADLRGAEGLTQAEIDRAYCNSGTMLPEGLKGERDAG